MATAELASRHKKQDFTDIKEQEIPRHKRQEFPGTKNRVPHAIETTISHAVKPCSSDISLHLSGVYSFVLSLSMLFRFVEF
jgi:hypothetical protein